jgi:leucyl aminopeptidase
MTAATATPRFERAASVPSGLSLLAVPVFSDLSVPDGAGADLNRGFLAQRRFEGKPGQVLAMLADDGSTILAVGVGDRESLDAEVLRRAGAAVARSAGSATRIATTLASATSDPALASAVIEGIGLGAYRYSGAPKRDSSPRLESVVVVGASAEPVERGQIAVDATCLARDLVNTAPRDLTPTDLADTAVRSARGTGVNVDVWDEGRIEAGRLGGLAGVAAGAAEPPRLIRMTHRAGRRAPTVALVGKGITFDSGGLSLKPPTGMMTMKSDMGGAAAAICATVALARLRVPVNVVCWVAATENMPSGTAIHPGDVLTIRNGKTVEVLNTDAEGRLVLADALSLAVEEKPDAMVDLATLTGAQRVALGGSIAAVMGNDRALIEKVIVAGNAAGEPAWELPLHGPYRKQLDSDVADIKNVTSGPGAGSIIGGLFLKEFVGDIPWAHLDIASPAWADSDDGYLVRGGTGWGTRTLIELIRAWS